jgi:hypothetical protein
MSCRRELPVVDQLATEYTGQVRFLSVAWKGTLDATRERAGELLTSGEVTWGLDETTEFFAAYGVPYQPHTVLITGDDIIYDEWPGVLGEDELRSRIDALIEASAGNA